MKSELIKNYIRYYLRGKTIYQVHSPFVFAFVKEVFQDTRDFYAFSLIEPLRESYLANKQMIEVSDFGAGSHSTRGNIRSIQSIAQSAVTPARYTQLLFRLIHFYKPKTILEMGTSLGISTLYQAYGNETAQVITLEGCPQISKYAQQGFDSLEVNNIELITGDFRDTLAPALQKLQKLDYAFFDGNHRKAPTLAYFEECLKYAHEESIFIFDDIYWSAEMREAWETIKAHKDVSLSIDMFYMGIVFFRKENKEKEHFTIIDSWKKPWALGFF